MTTPDFPPPMPFVSAPRPDYPRPLTMIAPPEALARVYAAAYLSARTARGPDSPALQAREEAVRAVRSFCELCTEQFEPKA